MIERESQRFVALPIESGKDRKTHTICLILKNLEGSRQTREQGLLAKFQVFCNSHQIDHARHNIYHVLQPSSEALSNSKSENLRLYARKKIDEDTVYQLSFPRFQCNDYKIGR